MTLKRAALSVIVGLHITFCFVCYFATSPKFQAAGFFVPAAAGSQTAAAPVKIERKPNERLVVLVKFESEVTPDSAKKFIADVDQANKAGADEIVVEIDSPGGEVDSGKHMAKAIENSRAPVTCVVDSNAASMGFYILQSCPVRLMTKRSELMIHEPSVSGNFSGKAGDFRKVQERLDSLNRAMTEHEAARMTISAAELRKRIAGREWYMNWDEAVKYHAVDGTAPSVRQVVDDLKRKGLVPVVDACL